MHPVVVPRVLLPIGISFFTFHAISYLVDVYRLDAEADEADHELAPGEWRSLSAELLQSLYQSR